MQKVLIKVKLYLMALVAIFIVSCSVEDGQDGAIGPQGIAGVDGANGTDGINGENGNANVITSDWFGPEAQYFITNGYTRYAEFEKAVPEIDSEMYNKGIILVYTKLDNFVEEIWPLGHIALLPLRISGGTQDHIFTSYTNVGSLKIRNRREGSFVPETYTISSSAKFRYVLIPQATTGKVQHPNFAKMSYNEVMDYFGLEY